MRVNMNKNKVMISGEQQKVKQKDVRWPCGVYGTHTTVLLLVWNMSGSTRVSRYQKGKTKKVKTNLDLLEQEIVSASGICWAICKSAPHPRQPRQHPTTQSFTGRMPFLTPNQQRQSTEGRGGMVEVLVIIQYSALIGNMSPSGCTVVSGIVGFIISICNRSQMRTSKCACLIFGVSIGLDRGQKSTKGIFDRSYR